MQLDESGRLDAATALCLYLRAKSRSVLFVRTPRHMPSFSILGCKPRRLGRERVYRKFPSGAANSAAFLQLADVVRL